MMIPAAAAAGEVGAQQNRTATSTGLMIPRFFIGAPATQLLSGVFVASYCLVQWHTSHSNLSGFHSSSNAAAATNIHAVFCMNSSLIHSSLSDFGNARATSHVWYRYVTSKLVFGSTGDLLMGTSLFALLGRRFERELGSRRYITCLGLVNLVTVFVEHFILIPFANSTWNILGSPYVYAGPYPIIGALAIWYDLYTPRLYPRFFGILGIHFSDKIVWYSALAQILYAGGRMSSILSTSSNGYGVSHNNNNNNSNIDTTSWWSFLCNGTIVAAGCGALINLIYLKSDRVRTTLDHLIPDSVLNFVSTMIVSAGLTPPPLILPGRIVTAPLSPLGTTFSLQPQQHMGSIGLGGFRGMTHQQVQPQRRPPSETTAPLNPLPAMPTPPPFVPNPDAVSNLTAMGFPLSRVNEALLITNNNIEQAAEYLLSQS
jgi:hypothetical protein